MSVINQLVMCEECRNQSCNACKRFKRRQRAHQKRKAASAAIEAPAPRGWDMVEA